MRYPDTPAGHGLEALDSDILEAISGEHILRVVMTPSLDQAFLSVAAELLPSIQASEWLGHGTHQTPAEVVAARLEALFEAGELG